MKTDDYEKLNHSAAFLVKDLREAHDGCSRIDSLILLPLIQRARELQLSIAQFVAVKEADSA